MRNFFLIEQLLAVFVKSDRCTHINIKKRYSFFDFGAVRLAPLSGTVKNLIHAVSSGHSQIFFSYIVGAITGNANRAMF